ERGPLLLRRSGGAVHPRVLHGGGLGALLRAGQRSGCLQPRSPRPRDGRAAARAPGARAGSVPRPRLRVRTHRARDRPRRTPRDRDRRRRQRACSASCQREREGDGARVALRGRAARADPERHDVRRDLVQPPHPDRQGGAARAAAHVAAEAATGRADGDGGGQVPRRRLAPTVAGRSGLAHDAPRQPQGVPGAGDAPRV
ncbi:MAG: hypothetical protein AVDCRST_MAG60-655, partial [uncultured Nocardioides sp.]